VESSRKALLFSVMNKRSLRLSNTIEGVGRLP
jgi:hypothetical protein